jgi:hypothetical protein
MPKVGNKHFAYTAKGKAAAKKAAAKTGEKMEYASPAAKKRHEAKESLSKKKMERKTGKS